MRVTGKQGAGSREQGARRCGRQLVREASLTPIGVKVDAEIGVGDASY
jgi:hypothetical protein